MSLLEGGKIMHDPLVELASGGGGGYKKGYQAGYDDGHEAGYQQGYYDGEDDWKKVGYDEGYAAGRSEGEEEGFAEGYKDGYASGYNEGYGEGRSAGRSDEAKAYATYLQYKPRDDEGNAIPRATEPGEAWVMCRKFSSVNDGSDFSYLIAAPSGQYATIHAQAGYMEDGRFVPAYFDADVSVGPGGVGYMVRSFRWSNPESMVGHEYVLHFTNLHGTAYECSFHGTDVVDIDMYLDCMFMPRVNSNRNMPNLETARIRITDNNGFYGIIMTDGLWGKLKAAVIECDGKLRGNLNGLFAYLPDLEVVVFDAERINLALNQTFRNSGKLRYVTPIDLSSVNDGNMLYYAFYNCNALESMPIKSFGIGSCDHAFSNSGIRRAYIGDFSGVTNVGHMFFGTKYLEDVHIGITPNIDLGGYFITGENIGLRRIYIGEYRFSHMRYLFGKSVATGACAYLEEVYIPKANPGLETTDIFRNCKSLKHVYMPDYPELEIPERVNRQVVYQEGYDAGYNEGETDGWAKGQIEGYEDGRKAGYDEGYADGIKSGGYADGFDDGYAACLEKPVLPVPTEDDEIYLLVRTDGAGGIKANLVGPGYNVGSDGRIITTQIGDSIDGKFVPYEDVPKRIVETQYGSPTPASGFSPIAEMIPEHVGYGMYVVARITVEAMQGKQIGTLIVYGSSIVASATRSSHIKFGIEGGTYCANLESADVYDSMDNIRNMFYNCFALRRVGWYSTRKITNAELAFYGCRSLGHIPEMDMSGTERAEGFARDCHSLVRMPTIYAKSAMYGNDPTFGSETMSFFRNIIYGCKSLRSLEIRDVPDVSYNVTTSRPRRSYLDVLNIAGTPDSPNNLEKLIISSKDNVPFTGDVCSIDASYNKLDRDAIVEFFRELPACVASGLTLTITGNPGALLLSAEDIAIATDKGWNVIGGPDDALLRYLGTRDPDWPTLDPKPSVNSVTILADKATMEANGNRIARVISASPSVTANATAEIILYKDGAETGRETLSFSASPADVASITEDADCDYAVCTVTSDGENVPRVIPDSAIEVRLNQSMGEGNFILATVDKYVDGLRNIRNILAYSADDTAIDTLRTRIEEGKIPAVVSALAYKDDAVAYEYPDQAKTISIKEEMNYEVSSGEVHAAED